MVGLQLLDHFFSTDPELFVSKAEANTQEKKELKTDDIRNTKSSPSLKRKISHIVSARQFVHAEMAIKGTRHALTVTLYTYFHKKEQVKLISTCPETHSIVDSAY